MKRNTILALYLLTTASLFAQPRFMARRETIDMGPISWKTPATTEFTITNKGDQPLIIEDIESTCGCTVIKWDKNSIPYNKEAKITVTYDAKLLGHFNKRFFVQTNAAEMPYILAIKGDVVSDDNISSPSGFPYRLGSIRMDKKHLNFEDVNLGDTAMAVLTVQNISKSSYTPEMMHLPPYLTATAVPERIAGGKIGRIVFTLDSKKLRTMGETKASIYISRFLGDKVGDENEIEVEATLLPNLSNISYEQYKNAPKIVLPNTEINVALNGKKKKTETIVIENKGDLPLEISALQIFDKALSVSVNKTHIKKNEKAKLKITVQRDFLELAQNPPRVLLITNDPENQKKYLNVHVN